VHVYLIVGAAVWGFASGLLVPRAAYRLAVPPGEPWAAACPAGHPIRGPVRGWLGPARCPECAALAHPSPYAAPDPLPDLSPDPAAHLSPYAPSYAPVRATALACALACAALAHGTGAHPELAVWLLLTPVAVLLARVDLLVFRLPDVLTLPALAATAALLGLAALLPAHAGSWRRALLGALALGALYLAMFALHPAGLGLGDVKLAPTPGLVLGWYGWHTVLAGTFAALLLGALAGLALLLAPGTTRRTPYPFGPFLLLGTLAPLLWPR
jgi:leader peptidase (prepilin peptidase) / N-methyltransferase